MPSRSYISDVLACRNATPAPEEILLCADLADAAHELPVRMNGETNRGRYDWDYYFDAFDSIEGPRSKYHPALERISLRRSTSQTGSDN